MSSFPHYQQLDAMDCGPTCLRIVARFYGKGYKISVSDPASGLLVYDEKPFLNGWLQSSGDEKDVPEKNGVTPAKTHGIALILEPTTAFYKEKGEDDRKMNFRYLAGYLRPYKSVYSPDTACNVSIKSLTLEQSQEVGGTFIDQTKNIIISFLAASAVIKGDMTLGMMMAMQYIIGGFQ